MRKEIVCLLAIMASVSLSAQVFTLKECRQLAEQQNKKEQINKEQVAASEMLRKAALSNFFPRFSANGAYMWNEKNLYLIPSSFPVEVNGTHITTLNAGGSGELDGVYTRLYDALTLDIKHVMVGQVGVAQPIFMGGKLVNGYKIAKTAKEIAEIKQSADSKSLIIKVDEAYWRVVSVEQKKRLAHQYYNLLKKLDSDVALLEEEGLATKSDRLKVKMKLAESEEKVGQAEDGLILSKMALCEVIGKDLNYDIHVDSTGIEDISLSMEQESLENVADHRSEVQILEKAETVARATKGIAASSLMPNIVASANYIMTNKSFADGINPNKYYGWFNAGVVVNVPIAHADAICRVRAARHQQKAVSLQVEEAREMIMLQATQSQQKVAAAQRKLIRTKTATASAKEVLRMAEEGFREGVVSSADLMAAQTQWMSAESDRIDAAIELRLAELNYRKNTGKEMK